MKFTFKIGSKIKEAWPIYKENLTTLLLMTVVTLIVSALSSRDNWAISLLAYVVGILVFYVWVRLVFALVEKRKFNPFSKEALPSLEQFWDLLKMMILYSLCILGGLILFIIPGLYLSGRLMFAPYLSVEKTQGARKSIKESWEATRGNGWKIFWKAFVVGLFMMVGFLAFVVGALITYPVGFIVMVMLYREFFKNGSKVSTDDKDKTTVEAEVVKEVPKDAVKEEVKEIQQ